MTPDATTYGLLDGDGLLVSHFGQELHLPPAARCMPGARRRARRRRGGIVIPFAATLFDVDGVLVDSPARARLARGAGGAAGGRLARPARGLVGRRADARRVPRLVVRQAAGERRACRAGASRRPGRRTRGRSSTASASRSDARELVDAGAFHGYADAARFVAALRAAGMPMAAASSSANAPLMPRGCGAALRGRRLGPRRRAAASRRRDLFLAAAAELGVAPARCLVVEDAEAGVRGGRRRRPGWWRWAIARGDGAALASRHRRALAG